MTTVLKLPRTRVVEKLPSGLLTLSLPPGMTLDRWVATETARLRRTYPAPKTAVTDLSPELADMYVTAREQRKLWDTRYELVKLRIREELGWAKIGLDRDMPFVTRRQYPVSSYEVESFDMDAIFPL